MKLTLFTLALSSALVSGQLDSIRGVVGQQQANTISTSISTAASTTSTSPTATSNTGNRAQPTSDPNCPQRCVRKEIRDLTRAEWNRFTNALIQLNQGANSKLAQLSAMHNRVANQVHGKALFLPWHRRFLFEFEKELNQIDSRVCLPYWDWTQTDWNDPLASRILTSEYFGSATRGSCVLDGAFKDFPAHNRGRCLRRGYDPNVAQRPAFIRKETLERLERRSNNYDAFRTMIEANPHALPHLVIGGEDQAGDVSSMYAPNDPIFWIHHALIDYRWHLWQQRTNNYGYSSEEGASLDQGFPGFNDDTVVGQYMRVRNLCHEYAPWTPGTDEPVSNVTGVAPNITDEWINRNGLDANTTRAEEEEIKVIDIEVENEKRRRDNTGSGASLTSPISAFHATFVAAIFAALFFM